uniref:Guanine nucleotide-binding protein subunit gamma n=1 Tax=Sander lucioperca TaxID=283035 RepID=A0A8D0CZD7_SANLU
GCNESQHKIYPLMFYLKYNNLITAKRAVNQLRLEASIRRIKVSQAAAELRNFCLQNASKDPLLVGVPSSDNPFRPPKSCSLF